MKLYFLLLAVLIFPPFISNGQIDTAKLESVMMIVKDKEGTFLYYKDWKPCNRKAIINPAVKNIRIEFENEVHSYYIRNITNENVESKYAQAKMRCSDEHGNSCVISYITLHEFVDNYRSFIKIEYADVAFIYRYTDADDPAK